MSEPFDWNGMLTAILTEFGCQTGTIHRTVATDARTLELVCQAGVPEALLPKINSIPFGKGIAGAAAGIAKILFVIFLILAIIAFFRRAR